MTRTLGALLPTTYPDLASLLVVERDGAINDDEFAPAVGAMAQRHATTLPERVADCTQPPR